MYRDILSISEVRSSGDSPEIVLNSPKVSGTKNAGTEPYRAILGVGFPLHKHYIQLTIGEYPYSKTFSGIFLPGLFRQEYFHCLGGPFLVLYLLHLLCSALLREFIAFVGSGGVVEW